MALTFDQENYPHILSPWLIMWLYMTKPMLSMTDILGYMVIKVHFDMTLTFDLEDHTCILLLVVNFVVVHIKPNPL